MTRSALSAAVGLALSTQTCAASILAAEAPYNADPTGASDSAPAINAALSATANGRRQNVELPNGDFRIDSALALASATQSQCLIGQGLGTVLHVSVTFDPKAPGVVVTANNATTNVQPCLKNLLIAFDQPLDLQRTAAKAAAPGGDTVTLASTQNVEPGMTITDVDHPLAIPNAENGGALLIPTVRYVAGDVVTLSNRIADAGVHAKDAIDFSWPRARWTSLGACRLTPGSPGCKYPWAIYAGPVANNLLLDNVEIRDAWNGVYLRGSTFHIGTLFAGAFNIGLDIDDCYNWPSVGVYKSYAFGINEPGAVAQSALSLVYYDGGAVAANLGRTDGVAWGAFQTYVGSLNITAKWTFGNINQLFFDSENSNFFLGSQVSSGSLLIGSLQEGKPSQTYSAANYLVPAAGFLLDIASVNLTNAGAYNSAFIMYGGTVNLRGGYVWDGQQSNRPMFEIHGGTLRLSNLSFDASPGRTSPYIRQTGGTLMIGTNADFPTPPGPGGAAGLSAAGGVHVLDSNILWNHWTHP